MADISRLMRLVNGALRGVDLSSNTLVLSSLKLSTTELTKAILDKLILINTAADSDGTFDTRYTPIAHASATNNPHSVTSAQVFPSGISNSDIASDAAIALSKLAALTASRALVSDGSGVVSASSVTSTELGYLSGVSSAIQTQINSLSSLIQNFEWQESVLDQRSEPPVSPSSGDRHLVGASGTGAFEGHDNDIAEYNGSSWDFTTPSLGTFLSNDSVSDRLFYWGGSSWEAKYFEATTASTGLTKSGFDIRLANASAANGISIVDGAIYVQVDNTTTEINGSGQVIVKDGAISNAKVAADAAIVESKLSLDYSTSSLNTAIGARTYTEDNYVTDSQSVTASIDALDMAVKDNADAISALSQVENTGESRVAGETLAVGYHVLREAKGAETAGRLYKADKDASSNDNFHAVAICLVTSEKAAGDAISVFYSGPVTISSHGFTQGAALFLGASGALIEASSFADTAGEAQKQIATVRDANTIMINIMQGFVY